jgi:thiopeptide-type bacteriocin biosynthesis protein
MVLKDDCNCWISAHIYFEGNIYSKFCDDLIKHVLTPFINKEQNKHLYEKYFFIRYTDNDPHIRVRFYGAKNKLEKELQSIFENQVCQDLKNFITYNKSNDPGTTIDKNNFGIKWIPYEPEMERYGGMEAIKVAEEFFFYSSTAAIEIIKSFAENDRSLRLGMGLASIVILLQKFCNNKGKAARLINNYSSSYLNAVARKEAQHEVWIESFDAGFISQSEKLIEFVNTIWDALDEDDELPDLLDTYSKNIKLIAHKLKKLSQDKKIIINDHLALSWEDCIFLIIPSYIHMMNNRLGIPIVDESYLAFLINRSLVPEKTLGLNDNQ